VSHVTPPFAGPPPRTLEDALARLRDIQRALTEDDWLPPEWQLTPTETAFLNTLAAARRVHSRESLWTILYGDDPEGGPEANLISVMVYKLRSKLRPFGIAIETQWGNGYCLTEESRRYILALKQGERPEPLPPAPLTRHERATLRKEASL
jgi:two-component system, cell cycle response regulator CtrA